MVNKDEYIEKVQRHFTKRLPGLKHMSYTERLHYLGLSNLELRRLHLDLIYCYKIVFGVVDLNFSDFFLEFSSVTATRGHAYKLYKPSCVNGTRSRSFAERIVNVWNFPPSSVNFSTLNAFKRSFVPIDFFYFWSVLRTSFICTFLGQLLVASVSLLSRSICFVVRVTLSCFWASKLMIVDDDDYCNHVVSDTVWA